VSEDNRKPVRLARDAYHAALAKDWRKIEHIFGRLTTECGSEGIATALIAWCDTFIDHVTGGEDVGRFRIVGWNVDNGAINEENRRPGVVWAHRLLAARASMDRDAFRAALDELNANADGLVRGRWVGELLESLALTVNSLPRGYGQMGRAS
jgi:hypothetical protein